MIVRTGTAILAALLASAAIGAAEAQTPRKGGTLTVGVPNGIRKLADDPELKGVGLAVLVSDLLDPKGYEEGLRALLEHGFEVHVIHVLSQEELRPSLEGDLRLVDQETGENLSLRLDTGTRRVYGERLQQFIAQAERFCADNAIDYSRASSADAVEKLVLGPLRGKLLS